MHSLLHMDCKTAGLRGEKLQQSHGGLSAFPGWVVHTIHD